MSLVSVHVCACVFISFTTESAALLQIPASVMKAFAPRNISSASPSCLLGAPRPLVSAALDTTWRLAPMSVRVSDALAALLQVGRGHISRCHIVPPRWVTALSHLAPAEDNSYYIVGGDGVAVFQDISITVNLGQPVFTTLELPSHSLDVVVTHYRSRKLLWYDSGKEVGGSVMAGACRQMEGACWWMKGACWWMKGACWWMEGACRWRKGACHAVPLVSLAGHLLRWVGV